MKSFLIRILNHLKDDKVKLFWVIFLVGILLRTHEFAHIPEGINQDEQAGAYEAYSILHSGKDKWGNVFPAYFPAWGSGQNVLYSYLSIPFIYLFDLNIFSARIVSLILAILSIPLFFHLVKNTTKNVNTALIAMLILAICPWHIMLAKWSLESNVLPFFLLLGAFTLNLATNNRKYIWLSLIPFALAFYGYGLAIIIIPIYLGFYLLFNYKKVLQNKWQWLLSILIFVLISSPFLLWFIKNNFVGGELSIEKFLPFSIPLLPSNRLDQVSGQDRWQIIWSNIGFFTTGMSDWMIWNMNSFFLPLGFVPILSFVGFCFCIKRAWAKKEFDYFLFWVVSSLILIPLVPLNINRANTFFIPFIALAAIAIVEVGDNLKNKIHAKKFLVSILTGIILYSSFFVFDYYTYYPQKSKEAFNANLDLAIEKAEEIRGGMDLYLTDRVSINYSYYLFFQKVDPQDFRDNVDYDVRGGVYNVYSYRDVYFSKEKLNMKDGKYVYILKKGEWNECLNSKDVWQDDIWKVGVCN